MLSVVALRPVLPQPQTWSAEEKAAVRQSSETLADGDGFVKGLWFHDGAYFPYPTAGASVLFWPVNASTGFDQPASRSGTMQADGRTWAGAAVPVRRPEPPEQDRPGHDSHRAGDRGTDAPSGS